MANASGDGAAGQCIGCAEDRRVEGARAGGSADDDGTRCEANPLWDVDPDPESAHRLAASKAGRAARQEPLNPIGCFLLGRRVVIRLTCLPPDVKATHLGILLRYRLEVTAIRLRTWISIVRH